MDDSADFADPFSYVPLKRRKKSRAQLAAEQAERTQQKQLASQKPTQNKSTTQKKRTMTQATQKNRPLKLPVKPTSSQNRLTQTSPVKSPVKSTVATVSPGKQLLMDRFLSKPNQTDLSGFCPICQMPLDILEDIGRESHVATCSDISRSGCRPCPDGVVCKSRLKRHYLQFSHDELARQRDLGLINLPTVIIGERSPAVNPRHPTPRRRLNNDGNDHEEAQSLPRRLIAAGNATMLPGNQNRTNGDLNSDIELTLNNPTNMVVLENSQNSRRRRRTLLPPDAWACGDGGGGREEIHPPVTQSTPLRRKRCISPIQRRPSQASSRLNSQHVRNFLNDIDNNAEVVARNNSVIIGNVSGINNIVDAKVTKGQVGHRNDCLGDSVDAGGRNENEGGSVVSEGFSVESVSLLSRVRRRNDERQKEKRRCASRDNSERHSKRVGDGAPTGNPFDPMDRFVGAIDSLRLPSAVGVQKTTSPAAGVNSVSLCRSTANPSDPDPMSGSLGWNRAAADGGGEDVGEEDAENDERFYDTIEDLPKNAEQVQAPVPKSITGESQEAGPSGVAAATVTPLQQRNHSGDGGSSGGKASSYDDDGLSSKHHSSENLCTDSPFRVRAVKDSQELELSLDLNNKVKCSKLKLRIPLKAQGVPVEVSARYSDQSSPSKQAKITSYFSMDKRAKGQEEESPGGNSSGVEADEDSMGSVLMVKRRKIQQQIAEWSKLLGKPGNSNGNKGETVRVSNGNFAEKVEVRRKAPFYKTIAGTCLAVDAFNYGDLPSIRYYFLSHFHYDHYIGLSRKWSKPIVCSSLTKRMVVNFLKVDAKLVTCLDPGESRLLDGVEVTSVDANHCPGSLMFVFRLTTGRTILHVGDFRADPEMESDPVFWNNRQIDTVYLDTTYCRPEYDFPAQDLVIEHTNLQIDDLLEKHEKVAILVGAYTIGKERIFKGIAKHLGCKVWAKARRVKTWDALQDVEIEDMKTSNRESAVVHVVDQKLLNWKGLEQEWAGLKGSFDHILGVKPTGWTHSTGLDPEASLKRIITKTKGNISYLEVPYSEHSSFSELKRFIQFLRIKSSKQIIPTVNLRDRSRMNKYFDEWIQEALKKGPESQ